MCQRQEGLNSLPGFLAEPSGSLNDFTSLKGGLEASQEAEREQGGLQGLLVQGPSVVRECALSGRLGTRWESSPLRKYWPGGASVRAEDPMGLNCSAEASVGKMTATRDKCQAAA